MSQISVARRVLPYPSYSSIPLPPPDADESQTKSATRSCVGGEVPCVSYDWVYHSLGSYVLQDLDTYAVKVSGRGLF